MDTRYRLTATEASRLIAKGDLSPVELVDAVLDRIEDTEPTTSAYVRVATTARECARAAADDIVHGRRRGSLHGIPVAVKDVFDIAGEITGAGLGTLGVPPAAKNADAVDALLAAGAILIGATTAHEAALGVETPPTSNPWDHRRIPGGSSGGSAAAVAVGSAMVALGTDTGGSVRIPATMCGVVGWKPTYGLISTRGVLPNSTSLDTIGTLTRTVDDAVLLFSALDSDHHPEAVQRSGKFSGRLSENALASTVIGMPSNYFFDNIDDAVLSGVLKLVDALRRAGATVIGVEVPGSADYATTVREIQLPEIAYQHSAELRRNSANYSLRLRETLTRGSKSLASTYLRALALQARITHAWREELNRVDVLIVPGLPRAATVKGETTVHWHEKTETIWQTHSRLTLPANLLGVPALALPSLLDADGLPCGVQLIGRAGDDDRLLRFGALCEQLLGWSGDRVLS